MDPQLLFRGMREIKHTIPSEEDIRLMMIFDLAKKNNTKREEYILSLRSKQN